MPFAPSEIHLFEVSILKWNFQNFTLLRMSEFLWNEVGGYPFMYDARTRDETRFFGRLGAFYCRLLSKVLTQHFSARTKDVTSSELNSTVRIDSCESSAIPSERTNAAVCFCKVSLLTFLSAEEQRSLTLSEKRCGILHFEARKLAALTAASGKPHHNFPSLKLSFIPLRFALCLLQEFRRFYLVV